MNRYASSLYVMVALLVGTAAAHANEVQITWTDCVEDGGVSNLTFACDTNSGSRAFQTAVKLTSDMLDVVSTELRIDIIGASPAPLPEWWDLRHDATFQHTACRPLGTVEALTISAFDGPSCPDLFALEGSMNIAYFVPPAHHYRGGARILALNAVPSASAVPLVLANHPAGNGTWNTGRFTIHNQNTLGTPSCAGCTEPVCILFTSVHIITADNLGNRVIYGGSSAHDRITWQGVGADCSVLPAKNVTWGRVKQLYR
jgi:hypothetical protein